MPKVISSRTIFYVFISTILVCLVVTVFWWYSQRDVALVRVGQSSFQAEIVRDRVAQAKGLSNRESLAPDQAMVFVIEPARQQKIWMKDMNFAIDAVWLDEDQKVVAVEHDLSPSSFPRMFGPDQPVGYVIELPTGNDDVAELQNGQTVKLLMKDRKNQQS